MYLVRSIGDATAPDIPGNNVQWTPGQTRYVHESLIQSYRNNPAAWEIVATPDYTPVTSQDDINNALLKSADALGVITRRDTGLLIAGSGAANATKLIAVSSQNPFYAVQIAYQHLGGSGNCTGILACVATTDDPGPMDYSLGGSDANLKKIVTPKKGGTEYNTLSANGWQAITWASAASTSVTDPGANLVGTSVSDIIDVTPVQASDGLYYALIRVYDGVTIYTRGGYVGFVTGTQYNDEATPHKLVAMYRSGDHVTDPSTWTTAITPSFADIAICPIVVRLFGMAKAHNTLLMSGDSRFDSVSDSTAQKYRGSAFLLSKSLNSAGYKTSLVRACAGGMTSATYLQHGLKMLTLCSPSVAIYNVYTVNDGAQTTAVMNVAKQRAWQFVKAAIAVGAQPVLVTSWPQNSVTAPQLALMQELDTWASLSGIPYVSPLAVWGGADGSWGSYGFDTNHGTNAFYQLFADYVMDMLIARKFVTK